MAGTTRRPLSDTFFDELKDWSDIKLRILTKYLGAYHKIRGSRHPVLWYVDGFAGTGRYGADENSSEGSPVRLARLAQGIAAGGKPYRLKCFNVELDKGNFAKLCRSLEGFDPALAQVRRGAFAEHLPEILEVTRGCPAMFFLDAFGPKPVTVQALRPVARRPDTEILINLNTRRLWQMAGFEDSDSTSRERVAKLRLVSEVFGEDPNDPSPAWLREWRRIGDAVKWGEWAAGAYMGRLQRESPRLRWALSYAVKETYRSNPKYHLIFLTRSDKAIGIMNDLLCTEDDNLFTRTEAVGKGGQMTFLQEFRADERSRRLDELVEEVHAFGLAHQGACREDLTQEFVVRYFGELKRKHYHEAVGRLLDIGRARRAGRERIDRDPLTFF